jgi:nucleoid-associated protein YgaU
MAEKAEIQVDGQAPIKVMFNPGEYSVTSTAKVSGKGSQIQFQRVDVDDFTVTLFFDTYEKGTDVRREIDRITSLVMPTVEGRETRQPSVCRFVWGSFSYKGIVFKVVQRFTMFLKSGIPVRAEVTVTFKAVITREEDASFRGKGACRKMWTVKSGDRLDLIAFKAMKDPSQWRRIAEANRIVDPLAFPTETDIGSRLIIPD